MRRAGALAAALAAALVAAAAACDRTEEPEASGAPPPAPVTSRAAVLLEPPRLRLGGTARVEVAVATPPEHRVPPVEPPEETPGLWVLGAERAEVEREPSRWVHRTRFRVRARETGRFEWPAQTLVVEGPEGEHRELRTEPRPFRVEAVEAPGAGPSGRGEGRPPFGLRAPARGAAPGGILLPAAAGTLFGAGALALVLLALRARRRRAAAPTGAPPLTTAAAASAEQRAALRALEAAAARAAAEPLRAADEGADALRRLLARRYGLPAHTSTTPELAATPAPSGLGPRWPALVAALRALDAVRFAPEDAGEGGASAPRAAEALEAARGAVAALARGPGEEAPS